MALTGVGWKSLYKCLTGIEGSGMGNDKRSSSDTERESNDKPAEKQPERTREWERPSDGTYSPENYKEGTDSTGPRDKL